MLPFWCLHFLCWWWIFGKFVHAWLRECMLTVWLHQMAGLVCMTPVGESVVINTDMMDLWLERLPLLLEWCEPQDVYTEMRCTSHTVAFQTVCCHWKASFVIGKKIARAKIVLLLSVNSNDSNRQVLIMVENHWSRVILETKSSCEKQGWPWTICTEFLMALDVSMDVPSGNIELCVDICATHSQDMWFLWNIKVVYSLNNCFMWTLWCGSSSCREAPDAKIFVLAVRRKGHQTGNNGFEKLYTLQ
jgi:hypothetical protein